MKKENILAVIDHEIANYKAVLEANVDGSKSLEYAIGTLTLLRQHFDFMWVMRRLFFKNGKVISTHDLGKHDQMLTIDLPTDNVEFIGFIHVHGKTIMEIEAEVEKYK